MTIIQITDLHIGRADEVPFDVDVRRNFLRVLAAVEQVPHDLLVISGDLCYQEGEEAIYRWIKAELDLRAFNYLVIPGNHDDTALMTKSFDLAADLQEGELFITPATPSGPALALIDSGPGRVSGKCLTILQEFLTTQNRPICLFMHHPPLLMGVPYMDDQHALQAREELLALLSAHPYPITIFTGHYHVEKSLRWKNLDVHVTPSCFFQIDWRQKDFAVDHHRIAYRHISWQADTLTHSVVYL